MNDKTSNLVAPLRAYAQDPYMVPMKLLRSAADEIERLTRDIDSLHDQLNARRVNTTFEELETDAVKWRALMACRISAMGCAGLMPNDHGPYAHLTLNFWTGEPGQPPSDSIALGWLERFMSKALLHEPTVPQPQRCNHMYNTARYSECPLCHPNSGSGT